MTNMASPRARGLAASGVVMAALAAGPGVRAAPPDGVTLSGAWMRLIVPSRPAGGYFTLANSSDSDVALSGVSSPACGSAMLHRSVKKDGQDRMVRVDEAPLPAGGTLEFAPGGYHVMCMQPDMGVGDTVAVTLEFSDGSALTAPFPVKGPGGV